MQFPWKNYICTIIGQKIQTHKLESAFSINLNQGWAIPAHIISEIKPLPAKVKLAKQRFIDMLTKQQMF